MEYLEQPDSSYRRILSCRQIFVSRLVFSCHFPSDLADSLQLKYGLEVCLITMCVTDNSVLRVWRGYFANHTGGFTETTTTFLCLVEFMETVGNRWEPISSKQHPIIISKFNIIDDNDNGHAAVLGMTLNCALNAHSRRHLRYLILLISDQIFAITPDIFYPTTIANVSMIARNVPCC